MTFVARQHGEAWNRPFVAVYEPSTRKEPSAIQAVSYFDAEETALEEGNVEQLVEAVLGAEAEKEAEETAEAEEIEAENADKAEETEKTEIKETA